MRRWWPSTATGGSWPATSYVDLDLSTENVQQGDAAAVGSAVIEATGEPHLGCGKFQRRFGWTRRRTSPLAGDARGPTPCSAA